MKFSPCISGQCTEDGTHCQGCGRSHEEIAQTKALVKRVVTFAHDQEYENIEEFVHFFSKNVIKKVKELS